MRRRSPKTTSPCFSTFRTKPGFPLPSAMGAAVLQWEEWLISAFWGKKNCSPPWSTALWLSPGGTGAGGTLSAPQAPRYDGVHMKAGEGGVCPWVEAEQSSHGDNHFLNTEGCLGQVGVEGIDLKSQLSFSSLRPSPASGTLGAPAATHSLLL